jgi:hypothetical protein
MTIIENNELCLIVLQDLFQHRSHIRVHSYDELEEWGTMEIVVIGIYGKYAKSFILLVSKRR